MLLQLHPVGPHPSPHPCRPHPSTSHCLQMPPLSPCPPSHGHPPAVDEVWCGVVWFSLQVWPVRVVARSPQPLLGALGHKHPPLLRRTQQQHEVICRHVAQPVVGGFMEAPSGPPSSCPSQRALTDEVGGFGGHEEIRQVEPLDERRVHGEGPAPAPRVIWAGGTAARCILAPQYPPAHSPCPLPMQRAGGMPTHSRYW